MVAKWHEGFVLSSTWSPAADPAASVYRLVLSNRSREPLQNFRLGLSGPARISDSATISGGRMVTQLSNFAELAPPTGFVLAPGADWVIEVNKLDYPLRHWTDGATTGFIIRADGTTLPALTLPTENPAHAAPRRRGTMQLPDESVVPVSIIPWPNDIKVAGRRTAPQGLTPEAEDDNGRAAAAAFAELTELLFPAEGLVRGTDEGGLPVMLSVDPEKSGEAYGITFSSRGARIEAGTRTGFLYGLVTLGQMARGARLKLARFSFPTSGKIADRPAMEWRGSHLDVARRFYAGAEVSRFLAALCWNKLNRFHWHLSDDEAWRVEIDAYPELTAEAAWRGYGGMIPPLLGSGPERAGGFYAKDEIRRLVAQADRFGIEVIPEIDVPGHCYAMLEALPQLKDAGENGLYHSIQQFANNCLNPGVDAVYGAIETIFGEMVELFPSRYFHVGADEVPAAAWSSSPAARQLSEKLGTSGGAPLQAHFLQRVQAFLTSRSKITGAWEEAAHGGGIDKDNCYLVGWVNVEGSQKLAAEGYRVVVAPGQAYYLDMANSPDWHEPGAGWAGWSSPEKTYGFVPDAGWSAAERAKLLGVQACIWSEPMTDRGVFDRLVFPRISAIAETGWTDPQHKDFTRFSALCGLMPNLYGMLDRD